MIKTKDKNQTLESYQTEKIIVLLLVVGIYLLIEEISIVEKASNLVFTVGQFLSATGHYVFDSIYGVFTRLEGSDIIGLCLIGLATLLSVFRLRHYLVADHAIRGDCSVCGNRVHRIHRTRSQLLFTNFLHLDSGLFHCKHCDEATLKFGSRTHHLSHG